MKFLTGLALSFLLLSNFPSAQTTSDIPLRIGAKLPPKYIPAEVTNMIPIDNEEGIPAIDVTISDVDYTLGYHSQTKRILSIKTHDPDFKTVNGLKVGSTINVTRKQLRIKPTFEVSGPPTPDGWRPIISEDIPFNNGYDFSKMKKGESRTCKITGFTKGRY
jgi:hypothetical protein